MNATIARRLVTDFLLPDGDEVIEVMPGEVASIVVTGRADWRVEPLREIGTTETSPGYRLFVAESAMTDVGDPEDGFAVLPDGRAFHLNDPAQLKAFHRRVGTGPLETAFLVASYVEPQPAPRFLVTGPDPEPPVLTGDGPTRVTLCTYTRRGEGERAYERWEVAVGEDVEWTRANL
ncbi:hypothetical protein [Amycolatopsis solani]|uniref:hypothetical protein n=1 Tax=Amycolatopsis solani TaxID=3028615 RepID=UPI0025B0DA3D|nr:hypothetical protein [Amycolatopsis sp. MEP2-6]